MANLALPYTFVNGTIIDAGQVNADFAALTNAFNTGVPVMLTASTTFYVAPGGVDAPGNGLSINSPARTITYLYSLLQDNYDLNGQAVTIQMANGSYTENVLLSGVLPGVFGPGVAGAPLGITIQGNVVSPGLVTLSGNPCFQVLNAALATIQGMTLLSPSNNCILAAGASAAYVQTCVFGATPTGSHLAAAEGSQIYLNAAYTISGGALSHFNAFDQGGIFCSEVGGPTVTLTGTPAFSTAFALATNLGLIKVGATFAGTGATGVRANATMNAVIQGGGALGVNLPGSIAGTTATGGQIA